MLIKCAWCNADLGEKCPYNDTSITHSICQRCLDTYFPETPRKEWLCNYCQQTFPHFKALIEHYEEDHHQELRRFQIKHKRTKSSGITMATNSEEACHFFGWNSVECLIRIIK